MRAGINALNVNMQYVLVGLIALVPASSLLQVKAAALIIAFLLFCACILNLARYIAESWIVPMFMGIITFIFFYHLITGGSGTWASYRQFIGMQAVISISYMAFIMIRAGQVDADKLLRVIIICHAIFIILKGIVEILYYNDFISLTEIRNHIPGATVQLFGDELRVYVANDAVGIAVLALIFSEKGKSLLSERGSLIVATLVLVDIYFTYTRLLWIIAVIILAAAYLYHNRKLVIKVLPIAVLTVASIYILIRIIGISATDATIERASDISSIKEKLYQSGLLLSRWIDAPFLGNGFGSYLEEHVRDERLGYHYEVQYVSLLMQIGIIGMISLLALLVLPLYLLLKQNKINTSLLLLAYILWLSMPFTNPYIYALPSSVIYIAAIAVSMGLKEKVVPGARWGNNLQNKFSEE